VTATSVYEDTRHAWRNIWAGTDFDRELQTLDYPRAQHTINLYTPYLDRTIPNLEAGCGLAQVVYRLRQRGYPVIGLDYAPEGIGPAKARFPELPLQLGDVHHLPYPANYFGSYLSFGVVEHFEQGPEPALAEAYRVLRPGGHLVLTVPTPNFVEMLRDTLNRLFPARLAKVGQRADYYERTFTHHELETHVKNVGFKIERVVPISHSYTFYGLHRIFRKEGYYQTSDLAETSGAIGARLLPWLTAFECLILATK
jgi:SAM-dependent methyltransferase